MAKEGKTFLVIEDNANDAALIRRAFDSLDNCRAFVSRNLSEARAYILGSGFYENREQYPFPNAVICDYRLGGESGVEFLDWLQKKANLQALPVIILSGAASDKEMLAAKKAGAVDVRRKPGRLEDLQEMLKELALKLCA
jgi:CheY-like chemotaxis protein